MTATTILSLPPELLLQIFQILHCQTDPHHLFTVLCLVCKSFNEIAAPLLYHSIDIERKTALPALVRTLREVPGRGELIREAQIVDEEGRKISGESAIEVEVEKSILMATLLESATQIERLGLMHWGKFSLEYGGERECWETILGPASRIPSLTQLEFSHCHVNLLKLPPLSYIKSLHVSQSAFKTKSSTTFPHLATLSIRPRKTWHEEGSTMPILYGALEAGSMRNFTGIGVMSDEEVRRILEADLKSGGKLEALKVGLKIGSTMDNESPPPVQAHTELASPPPIDPPEKDSIRSLYLDFDLQIPSRADLPDYLSTLKFLILLASRNTKISSCDLSISIWKEIATNWEKKAEFEVLVESVLGGPVVNLETTVELKEYAGSSFVFMGGFW